LPLLFVNKQISHEITQMLYSGLKPLVIDGYCLGGEGDVSTLTCWKPFLGGLPQHRYLQDFLRQIHLVVGLEGPILRFVDGSSYDFRLPPPSSNYILPWTPTPRPVEGGIIEYLNSFKSLSHLQIIIDIPRKSREDPPQRSKLTPFLAFHRVCSVQMVLRFELGQRFHDVPSRRVLSDWTNTWIECLTSASS